MPIAIQNPDMPPQSQAAEGDGVKGLFFPSSAQTSHGGLIPSKFFMDSKACQRCHPDIYEQWSSSAHRFSSFNNQWYRKSIEYMQDVVGVQPSKWCAGCHDPGIAVQRNVRHPGSRAARQTGGACRTGLRDVSLDRRA